MSDFSLTLVLQIKTSKIINDMAKVSIKSEKIIALGGIFFVLDKFDRILSSVIDSHLGLRSTLIGYQYSEIIRAVFSVFFCGGDCMDLPKSFMNQNTVFLLITAMAANFYRYIVALPFMAVLFGIKATDRVNSFLFRFIAVPAKWIKTARQYKLNIYSNKPYNLIWEHG